MYSTPILFLIFNRPDCTEQVFEVIRSIKPAKLFVAADGPRADRTHEKELCEQSRAIIKNVDWDCEVVTLFREKNLGCKNAVSDALKWFFSEVEYGIILEDDCVPDKSFFTYCEDLLIRYKDDERIGMICGRNESGYLDTNASYNFSTSGSIWGWASWKRVMSHYDENNHTLLLDFKKHIYNATMDKFERRRLFHQLKWTLDGSLNTWDYQLHVLLKLSSMLYIIPKNNLIQNIGFGANATHTVSEEQRTAIAVKPLAFPLSHPKWIIPNRNLAKQLVRADSNKIWVWMYILLAKKIKDYRIRKSN